MSIPAITATNYLASAANAARISAGRLPFKVDAISSVPGSLGRMPAGQREVVAQQTQNAIPGLVSQAAAPQVAWVSSGNRSFARARESEALPFLAA